MRKNFSAFVRVVSDAPKPRLHHLVPRLVAEDVLENGRVMRKMVFKPFDYGVPFTPQSGLDTKIGDLAYMSRNNLRVEHETFYMSNIGRNPIAIQKLQDKFGKSLGDVKKIYNTK